MTFRSQFSRPAFPAVEEYEVGGETRRQNRAPNSGIEDMYAVTVRESNETHLSSMPWLRLSFMLTITSRGCIFLSPLHFGVVTLPRECTSGTDDYYVRSHMYTLPDDDDAVTPADDEINILPSKAHSFLDAYLIAITRSASRNCSLTFVERETSLARREANKRPADPRRKEKGKQVANVIYTLALPSLRIPRATPPHLYNGLYYCERSAADVISITLVIEDSALPEAAVHLPLISIHLAAKIAQVL
ncbi:hypothetical protein EAG_03583 [Camponotus floridanus]|uniref:Uncharacterized protein n=1 Tax=Camponotus floridanus TaxID=104421 RepID=E2ANY1_CAMFO|nr:hypothetical protein EAG_03583 [Camponotus floridanus]